MTNEESAKAFYEIAWNRKDYSVLEKIIDPDFHPDWILMPEKGPALLQKEISYISKAIPDVYYDIKKLTVDPQDQSIWVWYSMSGTQTEDFFGFPPSNKSFKHEGASLMYFNDDHKLIDRMGFYCFEDIFQQLGYAPYYWDLHKYLKNYPTEK